MARLSDLEWKPPFNNPLPRATTTVTFNVEPEEHPDGGVRVTYFLPESSVQFVLPSPPASGAVEVSQEHDRLVEDHRDIKTGTATVTRSLIIDGIDEPASARLRVSVTEIVGGNPGPKRTRGATITFAL